MKTRLLKSEEIKEAGRILRNGGLVGIPTETVYGLAANALSSEAVLKIFEAKGRPDDNPLIVHIANLDEIDDLVAYVPPVVYDLAKAFWPGPLTIVLEKSDIIPNEVTAGLDTVAIRMPNHKVAQEIIREAGVPLAAPSANTSGRPSPTTAQHVMEDMDGRIDAVIDGGPCSVGVESTVITLCTRKPKLLRPGKITPEEISKVLGTEIEIDDAVFGEILDGEIPTSPGMKYKHYSPKANVIIVDADSDDFRNYVNLKAEKGKVAAIVFDEESKGFNCDILFFGKEEDDLAHANTLFSNLRKCDELGVDTVFVHCPSAEGIGFAVINRLLRAADFEILSLGGDEL
ncbi:MAG: threonylcarbamoyl-AMP synthase [Ruminococcaceae bacterium]|nr:threonylcarbamoyl-AMP synthase [Oscillospiraceae bacterium]